MPAQIMAQAAQVTASPEQVQRAVENFQILMSALQSDKIPQEAKATLFGCVYSNRFSHISEQTDKVVSDKQLDRTNPTLVLSAMAAVCGFRPEGASSPPK